MAIAALPENAVRAIGSAQTLTDSASLVKELIDNAIDGRATSIYVEISLNMLDDIRVKDNGHGIAPEDRSLVCTRYCTSKIRGLDDLRDIGGQSLGFRGEALASALDMSGSLTISTRIEGEKTASELKFDRHGSIASEKRTSLPPGTTVRVEKFLHTLPVRRQFAEKSSVKMLAKVKRLLQAYALARPHLRFTLKILKAKNDKANWKYSKGNAVSTTRPSIFDAATEIMGKRITDQCSWKCLTQSSAGEEMDAAPEALRVSADHEEIFTFEAVFAKPRCDASLISNVGQYLSVDFRPVSCARGVLKQIIGVYKCYVRSSCPVGNGQRIVDPFLCMNIICPKGSYDANVEPAKDDVLFTNPDLVLRRVKEYFASIYGELQPTSPKTVAHKSQPGPAAIDLLLARKTLSNENLHRVIPLPARPTSSLLRPPEEALPEYQPLPNSPATRHFTSAARSQNSGQADQVVRYGHLFSDTSDKCNTLGLEHSKSSSTQGHVWPQRPADADGDQRPNKLDWESCIDDEEEDDMFELDDALDQQARPAVNEGIDGDNLHNVEVSKPWTLAKLNASLPPPGLNRRLTPDIECKYQLPTPDRQLGDAGSSATLSSGDFLTPSNSLIVNASTPAPVQNDLVQNDHHKSQLSSSPSPFPLPLKDRGKRYGGVTKESLVASNMGCYGRGSLDAWVQRSSTSNAGAHGAITNNGIFHSAIDPEDAQHQRGFAPARSLPIGTPLSDIPNSSQRQRLKPAPRKPRQGASTKPFISPVNDPYRLWFDIGDKPRHRQPQRASPDTLTLRDREDANSLILVSGDSQERLMHPDLAFTMDYEARKQKAIDQRREALRQQAAVEKEARIVAGTSRGNNSTKSPHRHRQAKAVVALHAVAGPSASETATLLEAGDPRAYLLKVQQREDEEEKAGIEAPKSKRRKTIMLPFETMGEENYIGGLILPLKTEHVSIYHQIKRGGACDEYVSNGEDAEAFSSPTAQQIEGWEETLKRMVKALYRIEGMGPEEEMDGALEVDLVSILQDHAAVTADLTLS